MKYLGQMLEKFLGQFFREIVDWKGNPPRPIYGPPNKETVKVAKKLFLLLIAIAIIIIILQAILSRPLLILIGAAVIAATIIMHLEKKR